jgi:dienelactone hydrolase
MRLIALSACGWLSAGLALAPTATNAEILQETIELPVELAGAYGRSVHHSIRVAIFRDDGGRARAPFLILNHGRAARASQRAEMKIEAYFQNARYFASRGFVVFVPTRVGYGATGGPDVEDSGACQSKDYPPVYEAAARQSIAAIAYAKTQPYVDPSRGIVVGQSFGGTTAIALAAKNIPAVMAAVNFAGGGGGRPETHPQDPCRADLMATLFASYGRTAKIPTLWFYSENDQYWGPLIPRAWFKAFVDRGGNGKFVQLPPYKENGHPSFTGNPAAWKRPFEAFLASCCAATVRSSAPASRP